MQIPLAVLHKSFEKMVVSCFFVRLKSHFIKVMDNTSNKIATQQLLLRALHPHCWTHKIWFPSNAYDLLQQVHTFIEVGFGQVMLVLKPPAVCILYWQWISVIGPYQIMHLSLNFTFAFKSEEGNEHCWLKIREADSNKTSLWSVKRQGWGGQRSTMGATMTKRQQASYDEEKALWAGGKRWA